MIIWYFSRLYRKHIYSHDYYIVNSSIAIAHVLIQIRRYEKKKKRTEIIGIEDIERKCS